MKDKKLLDKTKYLYLVGWFMSLLKKEFLNNYKKENKNE
jgi:hypothetical protein